MNSEEVYKILVVDDDKLVVELIKALFSHDKSYQLFGAYSAREGLRIAKNIIPDIIISDYYMPEIDGLEFCRYIRNDPELTNSIFILLTAETSIDKKIEGLEKGVDDYIEKNISTKVLVGKVKAFLKIKALQRELIKEKEKLSLANKQLERNLSEIIAVLLKILEINIPDAKVRADRAKDMARYIAEKLGLHEEVQKQIVFGAQLHEIGKIGIPEKIIKSRLNSLSQDDLNVYYQYPLIGSLIVSTITGYEETAHDIYHQLENYDGSGRPEGIMKEEIPVGARILRAIVLQEEISMSGQGRDEIIEGLRLSVNTKLDPVIASHAINYFIESKTDKPFEERIIPIDDLKSGMVVAEDVFSLSGVKIMPKGMRLNDRIITFVKERNIVDPIVGGIYILGS
ncbi:MAG TPA: response regulator [Syntrophorhabdaceae bacterium]|nr:response regulator [Syntrophorhabdaceae bacterium]HQK45540.1 response regulator [Syntrophorhabdaceae bacterium]